MNPWVWLEYGAWAISAALAGWMVFDTIRVRNGFDDPLLPGGRGDLADDLYQVDGGER